MSKGSEFWTMSISPIPELVGVSDVTFVSAPISLDNLRETIVDLGIDGVHFGGDRIRHERTLKAEDEAALELPLPWAGAGTVELALSQGRCLPDPGLICLAGEPISQWLFLKPVADTWHVTGWIAGPVEAEALHASDQALEISPEEAQIYWAMVVAQTKADPLYSVIPVFEFERPMHVRSTVIDPTDLFELE